MTTLKAGNSGLLLSSQWQKQKSLKVITTVRIDTDLKKQVDEHIKGLDIDFTTFCHIALRNALQYGIHIPPMSNFSQTDRQ